MFLLLLPASFRVWQAGQPPGTELESPREKALDLHQAHAESRLELPIQGGPAILEVIFPQEANHLPVGISQHLEPALLSQDPGDFFRPLEGICQEPFGVKDYLPPGEESHLNLQGSGAGRTGGFGWLVQWQS
jgi:hypothetical protein